MGRLARSSVLMSVSADFIPAWKALTTSGVSPNSMRFDLAAHVVFIRLARSDELIAIDCKTLALGHDLRRCRLTCDQAAGA